MFQVKWVMFVLILIGSGGCNNRGSDAQSHQEPLAGPNMRIPLDAVALQMACEDMASVILVSMSNRLTKKDVFETKRYAVALGDAFDARFPNLPEEHVCR